MGSFLANNLSNADNFWLDNRMICRWTGFKQESINTSYHDLCQNDVADAGYNWCGTAIAAAFSLTFAIFSCLLSLIAVILVNPCCDIKRCCCKSYESMLFFISMLLSLASVIVWANGDRACYQKLIDNTHYISDVNHFGVSMNFMIATIPMTLLAACFAIKVV